jgi:hypothetical protein
VMSLAMRRVRNIKRSSERYFFFFLISVTPVLY